MGLYESFLLFDKDGTLFDFQKTWGAVIEAVLDRLEDGRWQLSDARYYGVRDGRFSVILPDGLCSEPGGN